LLAFVIAKWFASSKLADSSLTGKQTGSHEIWYNPGTSRYTTVPNHPGDMPEGTLRAILKQAGIDSDVFLQAAK
jgi:HicA toxin of bacterial toxin-antitoxin,